ncbi:hypothetical protein PsorP6_011431 [Peronosclerospora sorghi]|uniref:Uncharacterized protein n=1 Tax=Peronosclerospora sorghi TaxID=230839 RepID=A0ACC0WKN6_9STRA|nr:hypothetical protein PsorP6_011431 [Peronosclerospora sorghi]
MQLNPYRIVLLEAPYDCRLTLASTKFLLAGSRSARAQTFLHSHGSVPWLYSKAGPNSPFVPSSNRLIRATILLASTRKHSPRKVTLPCSITSGIWSFINALIPPILEWKHEVHLPSTVEIDTFQVAGSVVFVSDPSAHLAFHSTSKSGPLQRATWYNRRICGKRLTIHGAVFSRRGVTTRRICSQHHPLERMSMSMLNMGGRTHLVVVLSPARATRALHVFLAVASLVRTLLRGHEINRTYKKSWYGCLCSVHNYLSVCVWIDYCYFRCYRHASSVVTFSPRRSSRRFSASTTSRARTCQATVYEPQRVRRHHAMGEFIPFRFRGQHGILARHLLNRLGGSGQPVFPSNPIFEFRDTKVHFLCCHVPLLIVFLVIVGGNGTPLVANGRMTFILSVRIPTRKQRAERSTSHLMENGREREKSLVVSNLLDVLSPV